MQRKRSIYKIILRFFFLSNKHIILKKIRIFTISRPLISKEDHKTNSFIILNMLLVVIWRNCLACQNEIIYLQLYFYNQTKVAKTRSVLCIQEYVCIKNKCFLIYFLVFNIQIGNIFSNIFIYYLGNSSGMGVKIGVVGVVGGGNRW